MGDLLPDYGLANFVEEDEGAEQSADQLNDATFEVDMAQMHEDFLLGGQSTAGFFGDMEGDGFLLEPHELDSSGAMEATQDEVAVEEDGLRLPPAKAEAEIAMDQHLQRMLDDVSLPEESLTRAAESIGLRVSGLPGTLEELEARQLFAHFGPLGSFEMSSVGRTSNALLSYKDASVTHSACASLHGIPLGGSSLEVHVVSIPSAPATLLFPPVSPCVPPSALSGSSVPTAPLPMTSGRAQPEQRFPGAHALEELEERMRRAACGSVASSAQLGSSPSPLLGPAQALQPGLLQPSQTTSQLPMRPPPPPALPHLPLPDAPQPPQPPQPFPQQPIPPPLPPQPTLPQPLPHQPPPPQPLPYQPPPPQPMPPQPPPPQPIPSHPPPPQPMRPQTPPQQSMPPQPMPPQPMPPQPPLPDRPPPVQQPIPPTGMAARTDPSIPRSPMMPMRGSMPMPSHPPQHLAHLMGSPQFRHLPPPQQQQFLAQIAAQQQRMQMQLAAFSQHHAPLRAPPIGVADLQHVPRVSERMTGAELQLIIRNQSAAVPIDNAVLDDFYHHFWVMKGGHSKAKPLAQLSSKPVTVCTERKPPSVGQSLGAGIVPGRTPMASVRAPKPLIHMAPDAPAEEGTAPALNAPGGSEDPSATGETARTPAETGAPLSAERWRTRRQIDQARDVLIELRMHASSPAVMTPEGQLARQKLLQQLFNIVQADYGGIAAPLLTCSKGQKLFADLLVLWPPPLVKAVLLSLAEQMMMFAQRPQSDPAASFLKALASTPKMLQPAEALDMLAVVAGHGQAVLRRGLQAKELSALLLGLLCHPQLLHDGDSAGLAAFYSVLVPIASTSEAVWALLKAVVPSADDRHISVLHSAVRDLSNEAEMQSGCRLQRQQLLELLQPR